jgi:peptidoglycan/LPS O-acetylase OafA/YrhL
MTTLVSVPVAAARGVDDGVGRRDASLDAVKGLLVLLMVLYHWLNYFVAVDGDIYRYIRFITPSFVFITGFLITHVYGARYAIDGRQVRGRLLLRGLKLLGLFTLLNLAANLVFNKNYNGADLGLSHFLDIAPAVYVAGDGRGAAFEVLLPISYLLAAAPLLLRGARHRWFLPSVWGLCVVGVYLLKSVQLRSANLELWTMGLLGMALGALGLASTSRVARPTVGWFGAYALYLAALNVFDVVYPVQIGAVVLNLMLLYMVARYLGDTGTVARTIIRLGQYSLFAYILHIAILQMLARAMPSPSSWSGVAPLALILALALTIASVEIAHVLRNRSTRLDRLYRVVFA